ncbi:MAG: hypothetical protein SO015_07625 [Wujia sp.]|nr:hypothetical protein [Wujia sp.]MCI6241172.1 hypothetical protein [Clostridium sp.]MDY3728003.1 hypothetical protein [Wujia sp.]
MEQELIRETKEELLSIADTLYQGLVSDGIASMNQVIPNLSMIASQIQDESLQSRLVSDALSPLLSAMEEEDGTLMADLITYELVEILDLL